MNKKNIYAMIPARLRSTRLKMKNLALINNEPMIKYSIDAAKESNVFDKIFVNSDSDIFSKIANRYGVNFYQRNIELGSSITKSDEVVYDFFESHSEVDILVWVNSIAPFQTSDEISSVVNYFLKHDLDSLITVVKSQVHCDFKNHPVNYKVDEVFAQTQDLDPVYPFAYSLMMWKRESFLENFQKNGHALMGGVFSTYPVSKLSGMIIKYEEDLLLADAIMKHMISNGGDSVKYDNLVLNINT